MRESLEDPENDLDNIEDLEKDMESLEDPKKDMSDPKDSLGTSHSYVSLKE